MNKLHLTVRNKLKNACELLFCNDNFFEIQAAVFAGKDKLTFIDLQKYEGNLFELLNRAEKYVLEHINWRVEFGQLQRKEIPEISQKALREALVNSICHRDYSSPKGIEWQIKILKSNRKLKRIGADKGRYWKVIGSN